MGQERVLDISGCDPKFKKCELEREIDSVSELSVIQGNSIIQQERLIQRKYKVYRKNMLDVWFGGKQFLEWDDAVSVNSIPQTLNPSYTPTANDEISKIFFGNTKSRVLQTITPQ